MGIKSIINSISTITPNKEFKHRSLLLNIDLLENRHMNIELVHSGQVVAKGNSRRIIDGSIIPTFNNLITRIQSSNGKEPIENIQKELTSITDDIFPKKVSDFIIKYKESYKYLIIDDESFPINIPYGIFFFPDSNVTNCLSRYGFFLSEYYTIARSGIAKSRKSIKINKVFTISTEDLPGSMKEEELIERYIHSKKPGSVLKIESRDHFKRSIFSDSPTCMHFCCHGDDACNIIFEKSSNIHILEKDTFDLFRFKDNSLVILNICNSNYTIYDNDVPRSIANKIIDRNGGLIVVTEWPISDSFAYLLGTKVYQKMDEGTLIQIISKIKEEAQTYDEKVTSLAYSLKGNPNIVFQIN